MTPRQRQILELLRAGKVNKEIARELGIGLGTVKQHTVALFKKLKVRNRAMAVTHGMEVRSPGERGSAPRLQGDGVLESRPCVVMSVALPESAPGGTGRLLHQTLAAYAFDHDALFLARKGNAGDLVFGIQHPREHDLFLVLRAAHIVFRALAAHDAVHAAALHGGLTAGMVVASMNRHGGWSGEAIASPAIAQARKLALAAKPGQLALSPSAEDLFHALSPCAPAPVAPDFFTFQALDRFPWNAGGDQQAPIGRNLELARLDALLESTTQGAHRLVYLEGETGMGKSTLCRYVAARCARQNGLAHHFVCAPASGGALAYALPEGKPTSIDAILAILVAPAALRPEAVIIDDGHLLPADVLAELARKGADAAGRLVLIAARRLQGKAAWADEALRLGRLTQGATEQLVARTLGLSHASPHVTTISRDAAGVPLFAIHLARQRERGPLPLPLRFVIGARMDSLGLDHVLLRCIARESPPLNLVELAETMNASVDTVKTATALAIASGVLRRDDENRFSFTHSLLRQAVIEAQVE